MKNKITPNDTMCQMIYDIENIRPEQCAVEGRILGYSMYDFFQIMSGCSSIEECHIEANLIGMELTDNMETLLKGFISKDDNTKEYELATMKIKCGQFQPIEQSIIPKSFRKMKK